jgi:hypothetical protein
MATVDAHSRTTLANVGSFHFWMAMLFIVIAFGGFAPSYWLKILHGSFYALQSSTFMGFYSSPGRCST